MNIKTFWYSSPYSSRRWRLDNEPLISTTTFISGDEDGPWSLSPRWEPSFKIQGRESKTVCGFSIIKFWKELLRFNVKESMHFLNKKIKFNKTKRNWKSKIPHTILESRTLCFSWCKNHKSKIKLWWVGARERKKRAFFAPFILSEGHFLNLCVLSQYIVYWKHFQNIHTFTYQKPLLHTLFCLFLKWSKAFSVPLKQRQCKLRPVSKMSLFKDGSMIF